MKHSKRWIVVVPILAGLQLSACGQAAPVKTNKPEPAHVEEIAGTELNRVVLVAEAAKRLGIQTAPVREEQVTRKRLVGGEVISDRSRIVVKVPLSEGDLSKVDRKGVVSILPLVRVEGATGAVATLVDPPVSSATQDDKALYYAVESSKQAFTTGQRVRVELPLEGSGTTRTVIPYGSVIYDLKGNTWVYANPEPLAFVRERVTVDYIDGDLAVLSQGPRAATEIVAVGAAELYGTEFGVGH